jgi:hypothetical protein
MNVQDRVGFHGELLFQTLISRSCYGRSYFHPIFMGDKHPATDVMVKLVDPSGIEGFFFVQVKATRSGYTGAGAGRKLDVVVSPSDVDRLKRHPAPAYVAGIDVLGMKGYIGGITASTTGGIHGLPTRHPINCTLLRRLWDEVDGYWQMAPRPIPMVSTAFPI